MRRIAIVSIVISMLLHAMFGCCWHHGHAQTAVADDHALAHGHVVAHGHGISHDPHATHEHHGDHEFGVNESRADETGVADAGGELAECPSAREQHQHEGCPPSQENVCFGADCVFVKSGERVGPLPLAATDWFVAPVDNVTTKSPLNLGSLLTAGRDVPSRALSVRAHLALQVFLL